MGFHDVMMISILLRAARAFHTRRTSADKYELAERRAMMIFTVKNATDDFIA